jgi:two-component system, LuxR family, sensor kinase FixL
MSWVTFIWSMVASVCLTLAVINILVWFGKRTKWANLLFSLMVIGTAAMTFCELYMMRAGTPAQFGMALRWYHIPAWVTLISLVGFVLLYLRAGRLWLAWTICILRTLSLLLNFLVGQNLNYYEITSLGHIPFLGEYVSVAKGISNPWMLVGQLSLFLVVLFVTDATITVWRRGDRRQALIIGGSIMFFMLAVMTQSILVFWQIIPSPLMPGLFFMPINVAVAYELGRDVILAEQLSDDLRKSEESYRILFESAPDGIMLIEADGHVRMANSLQARLYDYESPQQLVGMNALSFVSEKDRERAVQNIKDLLQGKEMSDQIYTAVRCDGSEFIVEVKTVILRGSFQDVQGYISLTRDITKSKEDESERIQLRNELTHLSRVMTMNELSTSLAHEINQPLGATLNNAEAAQLLISRMKDKHDDISEILADIIQDTKRAGDVIRKIRGIVKKSEAFFEPLSMNGLIEDVARLIHNYNRMHDVSLLLELQPDLAQVRGDRVHLQQVLVNIMTNAVDAIRGCPSKTLTIRSCMAERDMVTVSVTDSGTGIVAEQKDRLFEPFFTTKKDGLGMGLRICRSIIEEHGGRIWAENSPTGGATFFFSLEAWRGESS